MRKNRPARVLRRRRVIVIRLDAAPGTLPGIIDTAEDLKIKYKSLTIKHYISMPASDTYEEDLLFSPNV
jgi:hypothetical protein